jgi:glycosyltransferase involved in cell wall biosynthesis
MRIWFVNQNAYAPDHSAGTRHYLLSRELARLGHEPLVIATSFYHKSRRETRLGAGELYRREVVDDVPFHWLRTPPYGVSPFGRLRNMHVFARRVRHRQGLRDVPPPDVIIGSSPPLSAAAAAESLSRQFGVPFVFEVRDVWPETLVALGSVSRLNPLVIVMARTERRLVRRARRVVTLLPGAIDHFVQLGARRDDCIIMPNGVDLADVPCLPPPEGETLTVMYAGAHGRANALHTIVDAARLLRDHPPARSVRFRFIGDGPKKPTLRNAAAEAGLENISFEPPVPKRDIYRTLAEADIFAVNMVDSPLYRHGISLNKLFDYLGMSRPVVFGVNAFNDPVTESGAGISVPPEEPTAFADALRGIADMSARERREMGAGGRTFVEKHHNIRKLAATLEGVLHDVTEE